jgi:hypothetical protein
MDGEQRDFGRRGQKRKSWKKRERRDELVIMGWWKWCGDGGRLRVVVVAGSVHLVTGAMTAATIAGAFWQEREREREREKEKTSAQIKNFSIFGCHIPCAPDWQHWVTLPFLMIIVSK